MESGIFFLREPFNKATSCETFGVDQDQSRHQMRKERIATVGEQPIKKIGRVEVIPVAFPPETTKTRKML